MDQQLKQTVLFEEKVYVTPKDMNTLLKKNIDTILLNHLRDKLENRCSQHGFVIPGKLQILSRSMGVLENGKFTGNVVYYVQVQGEVYNPANGTRIVAKILKRNKMGIYCIYNNAIRILIPRDLHLGNEEFDSLQLDESIEIEIKKSRFQIQDQFILSVGVFIGRTSKRTDEKQAPEKTIEEQAEEQVVNEEKSEEEEETKEDEEESGDEDKEEEEEDDEDKEEEEEDDEDEESGEEDEEYGKEDSDGEYLLGSLPVKA
jgi:hypothetical protein